MEKIENFLNILETHEKELTNFITDLIKKTALQVDMACNFPNVSVPIENFYKKLRIDKELIEEIINDFIKEIKKIKSIKSVLLASDDKTHFLILCLIFFLRKNNLHLTLRCNLLILIKHYSNLMKKYLKICDESLFYTTLDYLSKTHLFIKNKKSILQGLLKLNNDIFKKYRSYLLKYDIEKIFNFIYEGRHRVNQSCKSFVKKYHELRTQKIKTADEHSDYVKDKIKEDTKLKIIESTLTNLLIYKIKFEDVNKLTNMHSKLNKKIVDEISDTISNIEYDLLKEMYIYFLKDIKDVNVLNDKMFIVRYTRKLMAVKVTKQTIYFKKLIIDIKEKILEINKKLNNFYNKSTHMTQYSFTLAIAYYLTLYLHYSVYVK